MIKNLQIQEVELKKLIFPEYNPRQISEKELNDLKNSIIEFGYIEPIIINEVNNHIVGGNQRAKALIELGYETVPAIHLTINDPIKEKACNVALNKISGYWDDELLNEVLNEINLSDFDLTLTGFSNIDLEEYDIELNNLAETNTENKIDNPSEEETYYFPQEEIRQDIIEGWVTYESLEKYVKNIIDLPTAKYQFNRLCQGYNDGYNISLLFNPHRLNTETINSKSVWYGINQDESYKKTFAKLLAFSFGVMPTTQYYKALGVGSAGYQFVNEFKPYLARDIYKHYCKDGDKILNQCAGWGGRLIGLTSCQFSNIEYWETDPNKKTFNGLKKLKQFLKLGDNIKQFNKPFEELELPENYFDFAFTSPPYFNTELYIDDKYDEYNKWKTGFLEPLIDKTIFSLKPNGKCLLNIGNKKYDILTDTINYLKEKYDYNIVYKNEFKLNKEGLGNRKGNDKGEKFIEFTKKEGNT